MDRKEIESDIRQLEKRKAKMIKSLNSSKPEVRQKTIEELIKYEARIDDLKKQLESKDNLFEKNYMKHAVPIKSNIVMMNDTIDVLKSTEDEIIERPVEPISGTEVLFMDLDRRYREKDYQMMLRDTLLKRITPQSSVEQTQSLSQKLGIVSSNLSKLEAALH